MKAKVIETGEIVNVTPYPTWYKENGQGPDRREWDEDELEFIYSNKKAEESLEVDLEKEIHKFIDKEELHLRLWDVDRIAKHFYELGLKIAQKGE